MQKKQSLSQKETADLFHEIFLGKILPDDLEIFLRSLSEKGETYEEIAGGAEEMQKVSQKVMTHSSKIFDSCGTGGSGIAKTFNVSTTVAFVLAGGGITVAKHGNRGASSKSGSADVLEALGVSLETTSSQMELLLESIGIAFLFAQKLHPAMQYVMPVRKKIEKRTIFNILGPLTNPAGATHQVVGVFSKDLVFPVAKALKALGRISALVVHGNDGLDEITICDTTFFAMFQNQGEIKTGTIIPEEYGISRVSHSKVSGGSPSENAIILEGILTGKIQNAKRDLVVINAGAGFWISGESNSLLEGMQLAEKILDSGKAWEKLQELKFFTFS